MVSNVKGWREKWIPTNANKTQINQDTDSYINLQIKLITGLLEKITPDKNRKEDLKKREADQAALFTGCINNKNTDEFDAAEDIK